MKFDYTGDADDFLLERGDPLVGLHFRPNCNEPGERLIRIFSSEADACGPEWASRDGDDETAHLDVFAYVINRIRILDYRQFVRACYNHAQQQTDNSRQSAYEKASTASVCNTEEYFVLRSRLSHSMHFP